MSPFKLLASILIIALSQISNAEHDATTPANVTPTDGRPAATAEKSAAVSCVAKDRFAVLTRIADGKPIGNPMALKDCERAIKAIVAGVVCTMTDNNSYLVKDHEGGAGWRPTNIATGLSLGRFPIKNFEDCLKVSANSNGGIACTNTGTYDGNGWKPASIHTGFWCGSSVSLDWCLAATRNARDYTVCSYPGDGLGGGNSWVVTKIGSSCSYQGGHSSLKECEKRLPPKLPKK